MTKVFTKPKGAAMAIANAIPASHNGTKSGCTSAAAMPRGGSSLSALGPSRSGIESTKAVSAQAMEAAKSAR